MVWPNIVHDGKSEYFPPPFSVDPLPKTIRYGLIPIGMLAILSFASTLALLSFICFRTFKSRGQHRTSIGNNQYIMLVANLVFADLQQSSSFLISFHWLRKDAINAPSSACFAQGWLLHSGDVSSGFFVLAIAVHTYYTAVLGRRLSNTTFYYIIGSIWALAYFLTIVGVALYGRGYFVRAGAWCWVSSKHESARLGLHYVWVFVDEFCTIFLYAVTFFYLRWKTSNLFKDADRTSNLPNRRTVQAVNRVTMLMMLYPCAYVVLTLPLSVGRMWTMAQGGQSVGDGFSCAAGALITSCGWVDTLLYTLTRRRLLKDSQDAGRRPSNTGDYPSDRRSKTITHTRTITVEEEDVADTPPHKIIGNKSMCQRDHPDSISACEDGGRRPASPSGSIDPILSGRMNGIHYHVDTRQLRQDSARSDAQDSFELEDIEKCG